MGKFGFPRRRRRRQTPRSGKCAFFLHDHRSPGVSPPQVWTGARKLWCAFGARMMPVRGARRLQPLRFLTASEHRRLRGSSDVLCATSVACHHGNAVTRQREDDAVWVGPLQETREVLCALSLHPKQQGGAQRSRLYYDENASAAWIVASLLKQPHPPPTQQKPAICCKASTRFLWRR